MNNLIALTLTVILVAFWSEPVKAQQDMPNVYCGDCRGPRVHPRNVRYGVTYWTSSSSGMVHSPLKYASVGS